MIRYALVCDSGHKFESWFRSSADYDRQQKRGLVDCPGCGSTAIEKQVMRPSVTSRKKGGASTQRRVPEASGQVAMMSPQEQEFRRKLKELRDYVTKNSDYVGDRFPDLARKMHYEEIDRKSIYGEAQPDEVKSLIDDGVEVQPLPLLPEDKN